MLTELYIFPQLVVVERCCIPNFAINLDVNPSYTIHDACRCFVLLRSILRVLFRSFLHAAAVVWWYQSFRNVLLAVDYSSAGNCNKSTFRIYIFSLTHTLNSLLLLIIYLSYLYWRINVQIRRGYEASEKGNIVPPLCHSCWNIIGTHFRR